MRAAVILGFVVACSFDHSAPATPSTDAQPRDGLITTDVPTQAPIEVGPIATTSISYTSTGQVSYAVPANASLLLVSLATSYSGTTALAVRFGTADLTHVGSINAASQDGRVELWKLVAPTPGSALVTVVVSNSSSAIVIGVVSFTGTDAHGAFSSTTGIVGAPTLALTSAPGELAFGAMMWNGSYTALAPDPSQTSHWNVAASNVTGAGSSKAGAGTTELRWSVTNNYDDYWAVAGISLQPLVQ